MRGEFMSNSKYDIWAIQHNPEEIYTAIEGLEDSKDNTLYARVYSTLRVGRGKLPIQFNTAFISEDKQREILLMQDGPLGRKEFRNILLQRNIPFSEVRFMKTSIFPQEEIKEVWFAKDKDVLREALLDSKRQGFDVCEYYPDLAGKFELHYPVDEEEAQYVAFEEQGIRGAMMLEDKIIVLMSNGEETNVKYPEALRVMAETDMTPQLIYGELELPIEKMPKQYKKEQ